METYTYICPKTDTYLGDPPRTRIYPGTREPSPGIAIVEPPPYEWSKDRMAWMARCTAGGPPPLRPEDV